MLHFYVASQLFLKAVSFFNGVAIFFLIKIIFKKTKKNPFCYFSGKLALIWELNYLSQTSEKPQGVFGKDGQRAYLVSKTKKK